MPMMNTCIQNTFDHKLCSGLSLYQLWQQWLEDRGVFQRNTWSPKKTRWAVLNHTLTKTFGLPLTSVQI